MLYQVRFVWGPVLIKKQLVWTNSFFEQTALVEAIKETNESLGEGLEVELVEIDSVQDYATMLSLFPKWVEEVGQLDNLDQIVEVINHVVGE